LLSISHRTSPASTSSTTGIGDEGAAAIAEHLPNLTSLDLWGNSIGAEGAAAIAEHLPNLTSLNLINNSIGAEGAAAIAEHLPNLTSLNLTNNSIGDEGAAAIAEHLPNLTSLDLTNNSIGDEGAAAIAENLPNLTSLDLSNNSIEVDGLIKLLDLMTDGRSIRLTSLALSDNPGLEGLGIPELTQSVDARAILATYSDLRSAKSEGGVPFGEAKLVVLGDGAVGKTSLLNALIENLPCNPSEVKTPGVEHRVWNPSWTLSSGPGGSEVRLNVWDFGGQVILQQTHQYFLTERCIPLIVHDSRDEDDRVVRSWLKVVQVRAPNSPVIVVVNKCDDGVHNTDFDRLREDFPEIVSVFAVSCKEQADLPMDMAGPHTSLGPVREQIAELLRSDARLESVQTPVPPSWVRVRDQIRERAAEQEVMPASEFATICSSADHPEARVDNPDSQRGLLRMLHQMGVLVAHGLTKESTSIEGLTLLDPNWLTTAIYALLADRELRDRDGVFDRDVMRDVLLRRDNVAPASYELDRIDYIIGMMQRPEFTLAFRLPGLAEPPQYLLAEALPSATPALARGWEKDSLRFRYRYPEYRQSLIPTFLVIAHEHFGPDPSRWRFGCTLEIDGCPVLVTADREAKSIDVAVAGDLQRRRDALAVVRSLFATVHKRLPESEPTELVPLPDAPELDEDYRHLLDLVEKDGPDEEIRPKGAERKYRVGDLLDGVQKGLARNPAGPPAEGRDISINIDNRNTNTNGETPPAGDGAGQPAVLPKGADRSWADRIGILSIAGGLLGALLGLAVLFGRDKGWPIDEVLRLVTLGALLGGAAGLLLGWIRGDH
jgi:internalin A